MTQENNNKPPYVFSRKMTRSTLKGDQEKDAPRSKRAGVFDEDLVLLDDMMHLRVCKSPHVKCDSSLILL